MIEQLLDRLRTPAEGSAPVQLDDATYAGGRLTEARVVGPGGRDPSEIRGQIWQAMGGSRLPLTPAQLSNAMPPSPQLYERLWRPGAMTRFSGRSFPIDEELTELDAALEPTGGSVVVDVGCSEGLYSRHLAAQGARVIAVDHSRMYLRRARLRADRAGVELALVQASAQRLPLLDGSVDAVAIGGTMNEIGDELAALTEVARVLRPGGRCFIVSLLAARHRRGRWLQRVLDLTGIHFPTEDVTRDRFDRVGLRLDELRVDGITARSTLVRPA